MAQRGIIQSRLRLDTKEFYTRLDAALKKAQQTANAMQKVFSKPLILPTVPTASGGGRGGRTDPALAAQREAARQGLAAFRDLELAQRKNLITQAEFVRLSRDIERVLENERAQLERNTRGYAAYTDALRQINNGLNRGFNTQPAVRSVDDLSLALDRLQSAGDLLLAGGGLFALFRFINNSAKQSFNAATSLRLYREELERQGKSADEGVAILDRLGARFKINGEQIAGAALALTRYGLNASDIEEQLALVGASSVARTGNAAAGMNALADAYESGSSTALNFVGVAANLVTEFERYAATQGKVRDQLTRVQEGEAFTLALRREAGGQLASLNTLLEGYGGATSQAASESYSFGNAVGSAVTPGLTTLFKTVSSVLAVFNGLPKVLQSAIVVTGVLTTTLGLLAFAYKNIVDVLNPFQTASTVLTVLLKNEIVARTRLGAVLALLGTRYGLVTAAVAANTEVAVASAGSLTLLQAVMIGLTRALALVRVAFARLIANPVVAALAAVGVAFLLVKNNIDIFRPALEALKASFQPVLDVVGRVTKAFGGMFAEGTVLGNFLRNGLINVASLLALTLVGLSNAVGQVIIAFQFWGDLFSQGYDQALANFDRRSAELTERTKAATNAILDATEAGYGQVAAQNAMADSAENAAAATARLTEEQKKQRADFQGRAAEFELSFDQTGLEADIASAQSSIQSFIDEVGAAADNLPLGSKLRREYREIELDLLKLRERIGGRVIADTLAQAQEDTANAVVASMEAGAAKIIAQRDLDLEAERRAFEERTNALVEGSDTYNEFLDLYNAKTAAINSQANQALQQDAEQRLETQRQLVSDLSDLQSQIAVAEAEASGNTIAAINAKSLDSARQIGRERQEMLERVTGNDEAARAQRAQINASYDDLERQNTEKLTRDLEGEHERRANTLEQITRRTAELRAQTLAANQRDQGNEVGAIETELKARLEAIDGALEEELEAEGLNQAQITALYEQANAERIAARQEASRQTQVIVKQEAEATKQALAESNQELEQAKQGTVQGEIPRIRAQFAAEQAERRAADAQRLAEFKGTEDERQRLIADAGQREAILTRQNQLQINKLERDARQAYAAAVKEYQQQVTDAYVSALQTQITKLTELRNLQTGIVSSGSTILQFIKNREELTGGAGGANETQIDNFLNSQLNAYEELYRQSLKMNGPLEDRVELQEKIKSLIDGAKEDGYSLTLDPAIARLMESDEISQVANFPAKAAEALENTKALDERIAEATSMLTKLLGAAAGEEGLKLKVTIDKSGIEQAKQELANAFGPEQANKIIGQVEETGTRAGAGLMTTFADGITANRGRIVDALRNALQPVRDLLPSSPAKYGPLSDIDWSGGRLPLTFAEGMRRQFPALKATALQMASIARPVIAPIPTVRPNAGGIGGGGQSFGDTIIQVSGTGSRSSAILQQEARQFAQSAMREAKLITRRGR